MRDLWCYDIEQFPNFHSLTAINVNTGKTVCFVIHEFEDNRKQYLKWLLSDVDTMIGFNNINYDYSFIDYIMNNQQEFISSSTKDVLSTFKAISDNAISRETSRSIHYKFAIKQIDLYRIWHFDNKNKATSLKWVELSMNFHNIADLPYKPTKLITTKKQIKKIVDYNINDVQATLEFYKITIGDTNNSLYKGTNKLELRELLGGIYNINITNANDPKIGSDLILKLYCDKAGKSYKDVIDLRTYRYSIVVKDCLFNYLKFQSPEFNAIYDFFKRSVIKDTKQTFKNIQPDPALYQYCSKHKDYFDHKSNLLKKLNVVYNGLIYVYGTGGIHGSRIGLFKSDNEHMIIDVDVSN